MNNKLDIETAIKRRYIKAVDEAKLKLCTGPDIRFLRHKDTKWVRVDAVLDIIDLANAALGALGQPLLNCPDWLYDDEDYLIAGDKE